MGLLATQAALSGQHEYANDNIERAFVNQMQLFK